MLHALCVVLFIHSSLAESDNVVRRVPGLRRHYRKPSLRARQVATIGRKAKKKGGRKGQGRKKDSPAPVCEPLIPSSRIIGGDPDTKLGPYMAALYYDFGEGPKKRGLVCSGVLIAPTWVATAAHCVRANDSPLTLNPVALVVGENATKAIEIPIKKFFVPKQSGPKYARFNKDIAVGKLARPAPAGTKCMRVNIDDDFPVAGQPVRVAGYGITRAPAGKNDYPPLDEILRQTDVLVHPQEDCAEFYSKRKEPIAILDSMLCTVRTDCAPCTADSGGPLVQYDLKGRPFLIGIVSLSTGNCTDTATVYTRVSSFVKFMSKTGVDFKRISGAKQTPSPPPPSPSASTSPSPSASSGPSPPDSDSRATVEGTSTGTKALYGIGGVAAVAIVGVVAVFFIARKRRNDAQLGSLPQVE